MKKYKENLKKTYIWSYKTESILKLSPPKTDILLTSKKPGNMWLICNLYNDNN